ncbi:gluconolaconase [Planctomycetales bacterium]|nr:gluconolaconase [Planctomycetales bacterium]
MSTFSLFPVRAQLGESPVWSAKEQRLYFLDIQGKILHRFDPLTQNDETFSLETLTGCLVECPNGNLLIAAQTGIQEVRLTNGKVKILRTLAHPEAANSANRYNDGKCSPEGRFWFGSLNMNHEKNRASLYCWDGTKCRTVLTNAINSNGLGWSPDGKTMYWIDTPTRQVEAFDYEMSVGELSNRRTLLRFDEDLSWGRPDGMTVDVSGNLWIAHWDGGRVSQWTADGELLQHIPIPARNVTSLTFGGANLDTLFITTARGEDSPESGNLFFFKP